MKNIKKIFFVILLMIVLLNVSGCSSTKTNNEIYNKTYDVSINIQEFEELVEAAIEKASPAIISVGAYVGTTFSSRLDSTGSGVIYQGKAILNNGTEIDIEESKTHNDINYYQYNAITNYHVIEGTNIVKAYFGNDKDEVKVDVIKTNKSLDLTILSFKTSFFIKPLEFADSDNVKRGSFVIAIGSPEGYEFHGTATLGIVSYANRYVLEDDGVKRLYMQTDTAINPGNSGGALINLQGEVIGINTMKFVDDEIENMGFAIPSNVVKNFIYSF